MCVLAFAYNAHPRWRIVLAGNRDEFHERPAAALAQWHDRPNVIAGRDLQSGGSWLGVSPEGRLAVVTNMRTVPIPPPGRLSRGALIADYLAGDGPCADPAACDPADFSPFNLILTDGGGGKFLSNTQQQRALDAGIYGLSNGTLDEPWPKTVRLREALRDWLAGSADDPKQLFAELADGSLPNENASPHEAIFIRNAVYGTRCSTVVAIDAAGEGVMIERRFDANGDETGKTEIAFRWPS